MSSYRGNGILSIIVIASLVGCSDSAQFKPWRPATEIQSPSLKVQSFIINGREVTSSSRIKARGRFMSSIILKANKPLSMEKSEFFRMEPKIQFSFRASGSDNQMEEVLWGIASFESFHDRSTIEFSADFQMPERKGELLLEILLLDLQVQATDDAKLVEAANHVRLEALHRVLIAIE